MDNASFCYLLGAPSIRIPHWGENQLRSPLYLVSPIKNFVIRPPPPLHLRLDRDADRRFFLPLLRRLFCQSSIPFRRSGGFQRSVVPLLKTVRCLPVNMTLLGIGKSVIITVCQYYSKNFTIRRSFLVNKNCHVKRLTYYPVSYYPGITLVQKYTTLQTETDLPSNFYSPIEYPCDLFPQGTSQTLTRFVFPANFHSTFLPQDSCLFVD